MPEAGQKAVGWVPAASATAEHRFWRVIRTTKRV